MSSDTGQYARVGPCCMKKKKKPPFARPRRLPYLWLCTLPLRDRPSPARMASNCDDVLLAISGSAGVCCA